MYRGNRSLKRRVRNFSLAVIAAQAGCVTLVIVFAALLAGLWLDSQLDQRGPCTFGLLLLSIPVTLYAMLRIALAAISRIDMPAIDDRKPDPSD